MSEHPPPTAAGAATAAAGRRAAAGPRRRRWPLALLALLALAAAVRGALPLALERGVAWGSRRYLGLPARLENADLSLLTGRVVLEGLALGARPDGVAPRDAALEPPAVDPKAALVQVQRVLARLSWRNLFRRSLHLSELAIEAPKTRLVREADGRVDPLRHARPTAAPDPSAGDEPPADGESAWTLALDRFELRGPTLRLVDEASGRRLLELSLEDLNVDRAALGGRELSLGGLGIAGPVLRVRRELLLAPAAAEAAGAPAVPAPAAAAATAGAGAAPAASAAVVPAPAVPVRAAGPQTGYRIARVDIERATVGWVTDEGPLDVAVTLHARDVTADPGRRFPFELALELGDGRVRAAGDLGLLPPAYTGTLAWSGLPIPRLLLASVPQFAPWLRQADSSGDLAIDADLGGAKGEPATRVSGRSPSTPSRQRTRRGPR